MIDPTRQSVEQRMDAFRVYYNAVIYPELLLLEKKRLRLVWLMAVMLLTFLIVGLLTLQAHIPALSLFLWIPVILYATILGYQIRKFVENFKPRIVDLILEFIEAGERLKPIPEKYKDTKGLERKFHYDFDEKISQRIFDKSGIFREPYSYYKGEDYISGMIGNVTFEMSELDVRKLSMVKSGFEQVFRGIFFHANFHTDTHSFILIIPRESKQFLMRTIKGITHRQGYEVNIDFPEFEEEFVIYSDNEIRNQQLLSAEVYQSILNYKIRTNKDILVAFDHKDIYIAVSESKDILEPRILRSNVSYKIVHEFFEDLMLVISIVEDFDLHH